MLVGCKKDKGTPAPIPTLEYTEWYMHSDNIGIYFYFYQQSDGTIKAIQDVTGHSVLVPMKWSQDGYDVNINFELPGQHRKSYQGTYKNGVFTLQGLILTKR